MLAVVFVICASSSVLASDKNWCDALERRNDAELQACRTEFKNPSLAKAAGTHAFTNRGLACMTDNWLDKGLHTAPTFFDVVRRMNGGSGHQGPNYHHGSGNVGMPPLHVMELGTGEGRLLFEFAAAFPDAKVSGLNKCTVDGKIAFTSEQLGETLEGFGMGRGLHAKNSSNSWPCFILGDATNMSTVADASVDLVVSNAVPAKLAQYDATGVLARRSLDEITRVLRPGGLAALWHFDPFSGKGYTAFDRHAKASSRPKLYSLKGDSNSSCAWSALVYTWANFSNNCMCVFNKSALSPQYSHDLMRKGACWKGPTTELGSSYYTLHGRMSRPSVTNILTLLFKPTSSPATTRPPSTGATTENCVTSTAAPSSVVSRPLDPEDPVRAASTHHPLFDWITRRMSCELRLQEKEPIPYLASYLEGR